MFTNGALLLTSLVFAALGILVGIIFLADAWHTPRESNDGITVPLHKSPKMRGLIYVIGAGIIPTLKDLFTSVFSRSDNSIPVGFALLVYTITFALTVLIGLVLLGVYSLIVTLTYLSEAKPNASRRRLFGLALPYVTTALRRGDFAFKQQLQEISFLSRELISQRDDSVEFLTGVFTALVNNNIKHISGTEPFIKFVEKYLQVFIQKFLEPSRRINHYRACIYLMNEDRSQLIFLTGISPPHSRHSQDPLSTNQSLAGWAIRYPGETHIHIRGRKQINDEQVLPFEEDEGKKNYFFKSVIVCAIQPLKEDQITSPSMVLCIDCSKGFDSAFSKHDEYSFIKKLVLFLSVIFATAQASMSVSDDDLRLWLKQQAN